MKKSIPLIIILIFILSSKLTFANKNPISKNNFNFMIPKILSATDKKIYLEINKLQSAGNWDESYKKIKLLNNKILLGYLEYDKLMHPNKYRSSYNELSSWLQTYVDFPVVMQRRVYSLMIRRKSQQSSNETIQKPKYGNLRCVRVSPFRANESAGQQTRLRHLGMRKGIDSPGSEQALDTQRGCGVTVAQ